MRSAPLLALAVLLLPMPGNAQNDDAWRRATAALDDYVAKDRVVGSALVLIRDGEIVGEHYTGFADRGRQLPAGRATIWHWGSITKTLTAVAVMSIQQEQLVNGDDPHASVAMLDMPITSWVPELRRIHNPFGDMDEVTLGMMMSHTSGLQNGTWPWTDGEEWQPFEPTEWSQLVAMMPYMQLSFEPGSRYSYSNPAFIYLARAMQAITGDPWQGRIYKTLLMPLGMEASYFGETPVHLRDERSFNYALTDSGLVNHGPDFDPGITIPNGGWNAPVTDIARWLGFLMGSGDPATQSRYDAILPHATIERMWQPVVRVDDEQEMGLSFFIRHEGGRKLVGHTGTQANFRSFFWMDPATRTAVVGVVNTSNNADPSGSARGFAEWMRAARAAL
jgi:CubicO group peptidase (beta-lactamase class C family)